MKARIPSLLQSQSIHCRHHRHHHYRLYQYRSRSHRCSHYDLRSLQQQQQFSNKNDPLKLPHSNHLIQHSSLSSSSSSSCHLFYSTLSSSSYNNNNNYNLNSISKFQNPYNQTVIKPQSHHHQTRDNSTTIHTNTIQSTTSTSKPSPQSSSSSQSPSSPTTTTTTTTTTTRPPRPPTYYTTIPTLDASPMFDPTLYIKKYSKSNHTKCGSEASKRLVKAQNKIRNWIWDWDNHYCFESSSSNGNDGMDGNYAVDGRKEKDDSDSFSSTGNSSRNSSTTSNSTTTTTSTSNANKLSSTTTTTTTTKTTTTTNTRNENIYGNKSLNFALIGHGVPFQLLQDHVDVAWEILNSSNNATHTHHTLSGGEGNIMNIVENKSEAVECTFHNGSGDLTMNWMKIRTREGNHYTIPYPFTSSPSSSSYETTNHNHTNAVEDVHHSMDLYLTVMKRLSRAFGTILQSSPLESSSSSSTSSSSSSVEEESPNHHQHSQHSQQQQQQYNSNNNEEDNNENNEDDDFITNKNYWKHDKPLPIKYWKATFKRGFVYPPSATMFTTTSFSLDDDENNDRTNDSSSRSSSSGDSSKKHDSSGNSSTDTDSTTSANTTNDDNNVNTNKSSGGNGSSSSGSSSDKHKILRRSGFGQWTNPPILELFPGCGKLDSSSSSSSSLNKEKEESVNFTNSYQNLPTDDSNNINAENESYQKDCQRGPSFVRVTIQGIPSYFWNHDVAVKEEEVAAVAAASNEKHDTSTTTTTTKNNSNTNHGEMKTASSGTSGSSTTSSRNKAVLRDDMVPISLVFEACFHGRGKMKK